jgi:hypothetical protein
VGYEQAERAMDDRDLPRAIVLISEAMTRPKGAAGFASCTKSSLFCHSERSEESLSDLASMKRKRDSSLRSE